MTFLLSLLGLGGMGGLAWLFLPGFATTALSLFARVPKLPTWLIALIAGVIVLTFGSIYYHHELKAAREEGRLAGKAQADKDWRGAFETERRAFDTALSTSVARRAQISTLERQNHDQALRLNAALADDLSLHGPGKAAAGPCRPDLGGGHGTIAGGPSITASPAPAPGPQVPAEDGFALVPWGWLVNLTREHDDAVDENASWRRWYTAQADEIERFKIRLPDPALSNHTP